MATGSDDQRTPDAGGSDVGETDVPQADATPTDARGTDGPLQIALATMSGETHGDAESLLLIDALADRGVRAALVPWDEDRDWSQVPLVVSRSPWDYFDRHDEFVAWVRSTGAATRFVNHPNLLVWNTHKGYLAELEVAGVPVVPTTIVTRGAGADAQAAALGGHDGRVVIKPAVSGGARGTILTAAGSTEARDHLAGLVAEGEALVQPYLPEVEQGEVSLLLFAGELSHALRKVPAGGDFRVQEMHGGHIVDHAPTDAEREVARRVLEAIPHPATYARIDLVTTDAGPLLMEAELVEPELFLGRDPEAPGRYADVLIAALRG
jgi:glutathione synthase/RimK-type ligase-like ATP-grasp enzyme